MFLWVPNKFLSLQGLNSDVFNSFDILQCMWRGNALSDKVFPLSRLEYKYVWSGASKMVFSQGPTHSAWHTGASRDLAPTDLSRTLGCVDAGDRLPASTKFAKPGGLPA